MLKLIEWIKYHLPISRKEYYDSFRKVAITLQAITQADEQHSQIEMSLVQSMNTIMKKGKAPNGKKLGAPENDPAYK